MNDKRNYRHRRERYEIYRLRDFLFHPEKYGENGNKHRTAAHTHSAEHARSDAGSNQQDNF